MTALEWIADNTISKIFALWPQPKPTIEKLKSVKLVAHRGVHENNLARENSMAAFQLALDHNIWAIELDIQFTDDGVPVINHDDHCTRLFNRPDIIIRKIKFKDLRHQLPEILTLEEVIAKFGKKLHLMIEVKENLKYAPNKVKSLETLLSPLTPQSDYHLLSLTPEYLEPLFFAPKKALLDVIWLNPKDIFRENKKLGHGAIAGHFLFFTTPQISDLKAQGKKIGAGFLNSRNSLYREVNRGIDYIFTDHPLTLKQYIP